MRAVLVPFVTLLLNACTSTAAEDGEPLSPSQQPSADEVPSATDAGLPATPPKTHDGGEAGSLTPPSPPTPPAPPADPFDAARTACVAAVNAARATLGRAPLARHVGKEACADQQAQVDAAHASPHWAYLHASPSCLEDPVLDRQNECPGWFGPPAKAAPDCVAKMMAEGPSGGHYQAIANPAYTRLSCGVYVDPKAPAGSAVWLALNFY